MKPILFNTDMVRAILEDRKTATRRAIKLQPDKEHKYALGFCIDGDKKNVGKFGFGTGEDGGNIFYAKPPCRIGDVLYIREMWSYVKCTDCAREEECFPKWGMDGCYIYRTNYGDTEDDSFPASMFKWHPSIHMPKQAARIFLQVTDVRVEWLQEITVQDAIKEGIRAFGCDPCLEINGRCIPQDGEDSFCGIEQQVEEKFIELWDSTIPKKKMVQYGWDANPWVWVIEFKRIEKPKEEQET